MKQFLGVLMGGSLLGSIMFFSVSQKTESAIHEIEGLIAALGFVVASVGMAIFSAIEKLHPTPPPKPALTSTTPRTPG